MKQFIVSMSIILIIVSLCSAQGITFGLVADPQYSTAAASGGRYYNTSLTRLQQATDTFQIHSMRFVAILGDFINAYTATDTALALRDYDSVNTRLTRYSGDRYAVIGNHDCVSTSKPEFMARIACQIPQKYYSFDKGNYHFVVLDCNYNPDSTDFGHNNFTWSSALIPAREKQWLINDLAAAGSKSVFVFMHNVIDNTTSGEQILNAAEIRTVFETAGNVKAVFSGHKHSGGYWTSNGIHYLTMKGMVEQAPPANAFSEATVTAADDSLLINGYSNQTSYKLKLKLSIPASPILISPPDAGGISTQTFTLSWGTVSGAATYRVQIAKDSLFATSIVDDSTITSGAKTITSIYNEGLYYWRVNAKNTSGRSAWSPVRKFLFSTNNIASSQKPLFIPTAIKHNGILEVYRADGTRVMEIAYSPSATKVQLLNAASKTLVKGYYTYRFHSSDVKNDIVGKLVR